MTNEQKKKKLVQWIKLPQNQSTNDILSDLFDSIECNQEDRVRVECVFLHGRLAYINTYVRDKGEIYERLDSKYHIASLQEITDYWRRDRAQRLHEKRIKSDMGNCEDY